MAIVSTLLITVALIAGIVVYGQPEPEYTPMVAAGMYHTVGLKSDGTVVATGPEIELAKWNLIEAAP